MSGYARSCIELCNQWRNPRLLRQVTQFRQQGSRYGYPRAFVTRTARMALFAGQPYAFNTR